MKPLDPQYVTRLVKLLGMLGSDHAGERAAAALKANELIRGHGLTWADVVRPLANRRDEAKKPDDQKMVDWRTMRDYCARRPHLLRSREQEFIDDINSWRGALTEKQSAWLISIYTRVKKLAA
jgi:hypothetical protein